MQHVDAAALGVDHPEHRVHIGAVAIDQAALGMDDGGDLADPLLEQTQGYSDWSA